MKATKRSLKNKNVDEPMSVQGHLKELRRRLIVCVLVFLVGFLAGLSYAPQIMNVLTAMGEQYGYIFVFIAPQELIMVYFQIAMLAGAILALPVAAYEMYMYATPALTGKESRSIRIALLFGFGMFVLGILFAYRVSIPFMLYFLINLKTGSQISASISIQSFVSFLLTVFLIFGSIFEMPVIVSLLTSLGVLKPEWLKKVRKIAIVVIFLVAALITPPDVVSQIMVALPMCLLYEVSTWLSVLLYRKREKKQEETLREDA